MVEVGMAVQKKYTNKDSKARDNKVLLSSNGILLEKQYACMKIYLIIPSLTTLVRVLFCTAIPTSTISFFMLV